MPKVHVNGFGLSVILQYLCHCSLGLINNQELIFLKIGLHFICMWSLGKSTLWRLLWWYGYV